MGNRRLEPVLQEISDAIDGVLSATNGKSFTEFQSNWLLQRGVERALEIISEASRHLPDEALELAPEIPWRQIRAIGNILRHQYHSVADEIVWAVVENDLVPLRLAVEKIKAQTA